MTTDLEQRKAAALQWFNFIVGCCPEKIHECEASKTIRELLTPSEPVGDVEEKCGNCGGDGWYTWGHPEMPEQKQCEECCGQGVIPHAIGDTSLEYDGFRIIADPSVPEDMILCPDEKTQKTIHYRLHQNDELDKSCHDLGLEIIALKKAQQPLRLLTCSTCNRSYDSSRHMSCPECCIDNLTAENKRLLELPENKTINDALETVITHAIKGGSK